MCVCMYVDLAVHDIDLLASKPALKSSYRHTPGCTKYHTGFLVLIVAFEMISSAKNQKLDKKMPPRVFQSTCSTTL